LPILLLHDALTAERGIAIGIGYNVILLHTPKHSV